MAKILLDTNIYSAALRGDDEITTTLKQVAHLGICTITIGELFSGFKGGTREKENRHELADFLDSPRCHIYVIDENTADYYSAIVNQLRQDGTPIPTNDIWIAASAFQHGLHLFTLDKNFKNVAGLILIN